MKNEILKVLVDKYKLSEREHNEILEKLKVNTFSNKVLEQNSSVMFVIGQPGCGKTTYIKNTDLSNYVIINSDDYREFHKYSDEIRCSYPIHYTKLTNFDAHLWGDELFSYGMNNGYSVLREKAPVDYSLLELIKTISGSYELTINVVVTGNLSSLLATRERYENDLLTSKNARLSNIEAHNKCYNLLPEFVSQCLSLGVKINYIIPVNNEFKTTPVSESNYLSLLENIRKTSNKQTCLNYDTRMNNIKKAMMDRNESQEQFDELNKIENIYCEMMYNLDHRKNQE